MFTTKTNRDHSRTGKGAWIASLMAVALSLGAITGSAAHAEPICLSTIRIDSTKVVDSRTIDFRMKGGTVYRSALGAPCSGLRFSGFAYKTRTGSLCAHQIIRVLQTGQMCALGPFTQQPPARDASSAASP